MAAAVPRRDAVVIDASAGGRVLFNSYAFLFGFLPAALALFFALGRVAGVRAAQGVLVASSIAFYAYWDWWNLRVILPSLVINYGLGHFLTVWHAQPARQRARDWLIRGAVVFNLCVLGYYKYTDFLISTVNTVGGLEFTLKHIVLPLGVSFFTFEQIAYVVDAYRGQSRVYGFLEYCVFVTFYPHLIAGPIIQHNELMDQVDEAHAPQVATFSRENFALGVTIFVAGLFKKVVLADTCAAHVGPIYDQVPHGLHPTAVAAWIATIGYSLQLYFDFSGYSDMAIGLARMMNIKLPANFNSPYKSHNIIEFWRRWHLTLSRFLRVYLYIPLGGNRGSEARRYLNLFLTMLLGGLWHGAGWGFVIWGALNGFYLVVNNLFRKWRGAHAKDNAPSGPWYVIEAGVLWTFFLIMMSRVFFRSFDWSSSMVMLRSLFGGNGLGLAQLRGEMKTIGLFAALWAFCRYAPNLQEVLRHKDPVFGRVTPSVLGIQAKPVFAFRPLFAVPLAGLAVAALLMLTRVSEFLYFQF